MDTAESKPQPQETQKLLITARNTEWKNFIPLYEIYKAELETLAPKEEDEEQKAHREISEIAKEDSKSVLKIEVDENLLIKEMIPRLDLDIEDISEENRKPITKEHMILLMKKKKGFYYNDKFVNMYNLLYPLLPTPSDTYIVMRHLTDTYMNEYCNDFNYLEKYPLNKINGILSTYSSFAHLPKSQIVDPIIFPFLCSQDSPSTTRVFDWLIRSNSASLPLQYLTASYFIELLSNRVSTDYASISLLTIHETEAIISKAEWMIMLDFWRPIFYFSIFILFLTGILFLSIKLAKKVDDIHVDEYGNSTSNENGAQKHF